MTILAYRITQRKYVLTAFDGEGAKLFGGRWNSIGTKVVYTAGSLSLATLELLVHVEDISMIYDRYSVIPVEFDDFLVDAVDINSLPKRWNAPEIIAQTQMVGDDWVSSMSSVALKVPSAVTTIESNYLLNPEHPDFQKVDIKDSFNFEPDSRLGLET